MNRDGGAMEHGLSGLPRISFSGFLARAIKVQMRTRARRVLVPLLAIASFAAPTPCQANLVTFQFQGPAYWSADVNSDDIAVLGLLAGHVTYDTSVTSSSCGIGPSYLRCDYLGAITDLSFSMLVQDVEVRALAIHQGDVGVVDDSVLRDELRFTYSEAPSRDFAVQLILLGADSTLLSSTDLPPALPRGPYWRIDFFYDNFDDQPAESIGSNAIEIVSAPEPGTLALLGLGLAGLGLARRRKA